MEILTDLIKKYGERHPKKHGEWYRINVFDDYYLILDTWNGEIYNYPNGAEPSDTNNMYRVVYTFLDNQGSSVNYRRVGVSMYGYWSKMIKDQLTEKI